MNLTDLREVLDERSAPEHSDVRAHLMLVGVHHRIKVRRQRRRLGAAAIAAIAVAAVLTGIAGLPGSRKAIPATPSPSPSVPMVDGFPEYQWGTRVIATADLRENAKELTLTVTPASSALTYFVRCPEKSNGKSYEIQKNDDTSVGGAGCGGSFQDPDVVAGKALKLVVTFPDGVIDGFHLAVGQPVPIGEYVFPPRPTPLKPLAVEDLQTAGWGSGPTPADYRAAHLIRADPADPNRPQTYRFTWPGSAALTMTAQTPGEADVLVNRVPVQTGQWWDYDQMSVAMQLDTHDDALWTGHRPVVGQQVTVTVTPHRMSGDWALAVQLPQR